jgi:hypothetical protein
MSIRGGPEASSTGHLTVRDCPGGIRSVRRVSGLMITPAPASSGAGILRFLGELKSNSGARVAAADAFFFQF